MGSIADLYSSVRADMSKFDDDLKKGLDKAAATSSKTFSQKFKAGLQGGSFGDWVKGGLGIGAGLAVFSAAKNALTGVVDVIGDAVRAAAEEEAGIATMTEAIKQNDAAWDGNIDRIEDVIRARQDLAFADGEQRDSLRQLVAVTKDVDKALELQRTAMDLARLRGMSLASAGELIGKVYAGNLGILSRYGIVLEKGTTATEALAEIQRRAAGQAEAYADTTEGKLQRAQIAIDDAMEDLGKTLTPIVAGFAEFAADVIPDVIAGLTNLGDAFHNLERLMSPHLALIEDTRDALKEQAAARGLDVEATLAAFDVEQDRLRALDRLQEVEYQLAQARSGEFSVTQNVIDQLEAERDALMGVSTSAEETAAAVAFGPQAVAAATAFLDENLSNIPTAAETASDGIADVGKASLTTKEFIDLLAGAVGKGVARIADVGAESADATQEVAKLAGQVDLAKGSFKSFWRDLKADQERIKFFIRNPDKLRAELDKIESEIEKNERQKNKLLKDGFQKGDALALAAIDQRIAKLKGKQDEYRALGQLYGNAAEAGVETGFDPRLVARISVATATASSALQRWRAGIEDMFKAEGGPVRKGVPYIVGERRAEVFVPDQNGRIEPDARTFGSGATVNLDVHGLPMQATTPTEVVQQVRRAARMGWLSQPRRTGWAG